MQEDFFFFDGGGGEEDDEDGDLRVCVRERKAGKMKRGLLAAGFAAADFDSGGLRAANAEVHGHPKHNNLNHTQAHEKPSGRVDG